MSPSSRNLMVSRIFGHGKHTNWNHHNDTSLQEAKVNDEKDMDGKSKQVDIKHKHHDNHIIDIDQNQDDIENKARIDCSPLENKSYLENSVETTGRYSSNSTINCPSISIQYDNEQNVNSNIDNNHHNHHNHNVNNIQRKLDNVPGNFNISASTKEPSIVYKAQSQELNFAATRPTVLANINDNNYQHQNQQQHDQSSQNIQSSNGIHAIPNAVNTLNTLNTVPGVGGTVITVTRSHRKTAPLPRLVSKNGQVNLFLNNIDRRQYMRDLFTTMIDIKWRYNLAAAALGFIISWLIFASIWYIVLYVHGDLDHANDPNWSPCILNVNSFPSALLFSIETQSTLGFGSRIISVECPNAIVIFCMQLIFGVVIECLIVGIVFAKLSRPAKRSQTIMFSKMATIGLREGRLCLMFRVGDVRSKSYIIGAKMRISLVTHKVTQEGEIIPFFHHQMNARIDSSPNNLLLIWPVLVIHEIDENSPIYRLNAQQLANYKFEIVTVLEGTVESTGQSIQARSSYLPSEVKWGYRFEQIFSTHGYGPYAQTIIDYNKFNGIVEVANIPRCSAAEYYQTKKILQHSNSKALALTEVDVNNNIQWPAN